jgi:signal transduction histidine kinase
MGAGLFRKYYLVTAFIVLVFIFAGFMASRLILQNNTPTNEGRFSAFYARLIDRISPQDRVKGLTAIIDSNSGGAAQNSRFAIVDANGILLFPKGDTLPFEWSSVQKPDRPYDTISIQPPTQSPTRSAEAHFQELIRFNGEPAQYLYMSRRAFGGPGRRFSSIFLWTFGSLVVSVLLGIGFAMFILVRSLRESVDLADTVIADLQGGNLKARFPIHGNNDEIGRVMTRFNRMAGEIERLVEQIRGVEKARMTLLQELAHDLRTPVASLKNLLETLETYQLREAQKSGEKNPVGLELVTLAVTEVEYFERLVEDLLVLAQVSEPRYQSGKDQVPFNELLEDEVDTVAGHHQIALNKSIPAEPIYVRGDAHLLRRMVRNGLENAVSFAKKEVSVRLEAVDARQIRLVIEDDGPGFAAEALKAYGERRISRVLGSHGTERLSVGLGSVILKTVAQVHGGAVEVGNRAGTSGARLAILIPKIEKR